MATTHDLVELLRGHDATEVSGFIRGEWSQNLWTFDDSVRVRPGWGQVAELDTTLGLAIDSTVFGYTKHLGSASIETIFGHSQILSVFRGKTSTSSILGEEDKAEWADLFFVRIYDVTTDRHYEEVLYKQTSEMRASGTDFPMSLWHGNYETDMEQNHTGFAHGTSSEFYFHVSEGYLYFGSEDAGVYVYRPADFRDIRPQWLENTELIEYSSGYAESSILVRMSFTDGSFKDNFRYQTDSDMPRIVDITDFNGRFVYASARTVFFSDPFRPNAVMSLNQVTIPSTNPVTAVESLNGNLLIFTRNETFLFTPSVGSLASQGRLTKISSDMGTFSPNSTCRAGSQLFFVGSAGVFSTSDGIGMSEVSSGISNFFTGTGSVTNPMTSFFESSAYTALKPFAEGFSDTTDQPRTLIKFDESGVSMAFSIKTKTLLVSFPSINTVWCYKGGWSVWPVESIAKVAGAPAAPVVGVNQNLLNPWVTECAGDFYMTVGIDTQQLDDAGKSHAQLLNSGTALAIDSTLSSYAILRLGLGGSIDRSCANEDYRLFPRRYLADYLNLSSGVGPIARQTNGIFYLREPEYDPTGATGYWIPLELMPGEGLAAVLNGYVLRMKFDNANYSAEPNPATAVVTVRLPPERIGTAANVAVTTCNAAGVPSAAGDHIQFSFTGATIHLARKNSNPLLYFKLAPTSGSTTSSFGFQTVLSAVVDSGGGSQAANVYAYSPFRVSAEKKDDNARAQPIDWAFLASSKGVKDSLIRARGLFSRLASRGSTDATDGLLANGWLWGIYNVVLGSDRKQYSTQVLDISSAVLNPAITKILDKASIRNRYRKMDGTLTKRIFGGGPKWGVLADDNAGNYLIDDTQTDNIVISDSTKGEEISYMVFGFLRGRAEGLVLESILASIYPLGRRRRTGR